MFHWFIATVQIRRNTVRHGLVWLAVASISAVLFFRDPHTSSLFPPCPFRAVTGYHCAGCGSLRALHRLMHGDVWSALRLNPLMVISLPLMAFALVSTKWRHLQPAWIGRLTSKPIWPKSILTVLLLYWALRNLPFAPFSWLAPHDAVSM
jgi:hypothetical protein